MWIIGRGFARQIGGMTKSPFITALMAATPLPEMGRAPEWIQLLPASSGAVQTRDRRGPYFVEDAQAIIAASMAEADRLVIDECHATDKGEIARARGWIEEMEARPDGIWARVTWNPSGIALLEDRAYRGISPVIYHDKAKRIMSIARASLTNTPNLRGMVALNQEDQMTLIERLAELLGLGADASEDDVFAAVEAKIADTPALNEISIALGLGADAAPDDIVSAAQSAITVDEHDALRGELNEAVAQLNEQTETARRTAAESYVDGEIKRGRAGLKPMRDRYIAMHMEDPGGTAELIGAMPTFGARPPKPKAPETGLTTALNNQQRDVAARMGISEDAFLKALNEQEQA